MPGIVEWLEEVERGAAEMYGLAARHFAADRPLSDFLAKLAEEELWHHELVRSMGPGLDFAPPFALDDATRENISGLFARARGRIVSGTLTRQELLETIVSAEFSEWNEIFLYALHALKGRSGHYEAAVLEIERHKEEIVAFLEKEPQGGRLLETLRQLPSVSGKRILVIEAHNPMAMLLRSVLSPIGEVVVAASGPEGLALVEDSDFDVVLSDVDMPEMESLEFYDRVVHMTPDMKNRFVFFAGAPPLETRREATLLNKPALLSQIRRTVAAVANGSRVFH